MNEKVLGPWEIVWAKFKKKNKLAIAGLVILTLLIFFGAIFAPYLTPYEHDTMSSFRNQAPSAEHLLGTDNLGRDYLTRLLYGGRVSLQVGLFAVIISVILGGVIGGIAGYYGGFIDNVLMRFFSEIVMSFPFLPLAITISALIGARLPSEYKMYITMAVIGMLSWPGLARIIRGQILSLREQEFMQAATALGINDARKIMRHLLPNTIGLVIVYSTLGMAGAILTESGLSFFLGLGVAPPTPTWGNLVQIARDSYVLQNRPWLWIPPGFCIFLAVISINLIGDGLRDAIDPKSKTKGAK